MDKTKTVGLIGMLVEGGLDIWDRIKARKRARREAEIKAALKAALDDIAEGATRIDDLLERETLRFKHPGHVVKEKE